MSITSGIGSATSSGNILLATRNSGDYGSSGLLALSAGSLSLGNSGPIIVGSGRAFCGRAFCRRLDISFCRRWVLRARWIGVQRSWTFLSDGDKVLISSGSRCKFSSSGKLVISSADAGSSGSTSSGLLILSSGISNCGTSGSLNFFRTLLQRRRWSYTTRCRSGHKWGQWRNLAHRWVIVRFQRRKHSVS